MFSSYLNLYLFNSLYFHTLIHNFNFFQYPACCIISKIKIQLIGSKSRWCHMRILISIPSTDILNLKPSM